MFGFIIQTLLTSRIITSCNCNHSRPIIHCKPFCAVSKQLIDQSILPKSATISILCDDCSDQSSRRRSLRHSGCVALAIKSRWIVICVGDTDSHCSRGRQFRVCVDFLGHHEDDKFSLVGVFVVERTVCDAYADGGWTSCVGRVYFEGAWDVFKS